MKADTLDNFAMTDVPKYEITIPAITGSRTCTHLGYLGTKLWKMPQGYRDLSTFKVLEHTISDLFRHKSAGVDLGSADILHPME